MFIIDYSFTIELPGSDRNGIFYEFELPPSNIKWVNIVQIFKYSYMKFYKYSNIKLMNTLKIFKYQMGISNKDMGSGSEWNFFNI